MASLTHKQDFPVPIRFIMLPPASDRIRTWAAAIGQAVPELDVVVCATRREALEALPQTRAAYGQLDPELLSAASRLEWLACYAAGPSPGYYFPQLIDSPVTVTNTRGIYNDHISCHIMAFVLAFSRGLHVYLPSQLKRKWVHDSGPPVINLPQATCVLIGVGGIGAATARQCANWEMHVVGIDPRCPQPPESVSELYRPEQLDEHIGRGDFVIVTAPQTPATQGLIDRTRLAKMKPSGVLINIGRGTTVHLDDLADALYAGTIGGAALDVFETEPLPADHRLWTAPNFLMTPHVAGEGPHLEQRRLDLLIDNARRLVRGDPLVNVVDKRNWF